MDINIFMLRPQKIMSCQIDKLTKQMEVVISSKNRVDNAQQFLKYDFCDGGHNNGKYSPEEGGDVNFMGNKQRQDGNPYSNTYNLGYMNNSNFSFQIVKNLVY